MATSRIDLTTSWQKIAEAEQEFLVDNLSSPNIEVTFQDNTPATDAAYHVLESGQGLTRLGLTGSLWARSNSNAFVIVTV
jgi:uncharacterized protein YaaW (UPF0174 family)